jgi:hypothetical protein
MRDPPNGTTVADVTVDGGTLFLTPYINDSSSGSGSDTINSQDEGEDNEKIDFLGDVDDMYPTTPIRPNPHFPSSYAEDAYDPPPQQADWNDPWSTNPWTDSTWKGTDIPSESFSVPISTHLDTSFDSAQFSSTPSSNIKATSDVPDPFDVAFGFSDHHAHHHPNISISPTTAPVPAPVPTPAAAIDMPRMKAVGQSQVSSNSPSSSRSSNVKSHRRPNSPDVKIHVVLEERLSILFDDSTKDPICRIVGRIFVRLPPETEKRKCTIDSFCLTIRDKRAHIEHWDNGNSRCHNITAGVPHLSLDPGDQIFLVKLTGDQNELEEPIVGYTCIPRLRPMPMVSFLDHYASRVLCSDIHCNELMFLSFFRSSSKRRCTEKSSNVALGSEYEPTHKTHTP